MRDADRRVALLWAGVDYLGGRGIEGLTRRTGRQEVTQLLGFELRILAEVIRAKWSYFTVHEEGISTDFVCPNRDAKHVI